MVEDIVWFEHDTFVCLDLPEPKASEVLAIRRRHRDEFRSALPAEITVAGSSGNGPLEPGQDPEHVLAVIDDIAATTPPIRAEFGPVLRFPGTDIFVFTLRDEVPLRDLHQRIATSGLRFRPSPFPFSPHCTLGSRSPVSDAEADQMLSLTPPGAFILDAVAVYVLAGLPLTTLHRTRLTG
jgi:2'-5' RNA ligase